MALLAQWITKCGAGGSLPTHAALLNLQHCTPLQHKLQLLLDNPVHSAAPFKAELSRCVCTEIPREWTHALQELPSSKSYYYPHVLGSWWVRPEDCKEQWPVCALILLLTACPPKNRWKQLQLVGGVSFFILLLCNQDITKQSTELLMCCRAGPVSLGVMLLQQETPLPGVTAPSCCLKGVCCHLVSGLSWTKASVLPSLKIPVVSDLCVSIPVDSSHGDFRHRGTFRRSWRNLLWFAQRFLPDFYRSPDGQDGTCSSGIPLEWLSLWAGLCCWSGWSRYSPAGTGKAPFPKTWLKEVLFGRHSPTLAKLKAAYTVS